MSSTTFLGDSDTAAEAFCPAPPPPPPPPMPGQVPNLRIATAENNLSRSRPLSTGNDAYEPPAAIQNAMMTKDKKPFTYTPGMGGKLDLSQIRSPRMARRVAKNANDEGIEGPPKSALEPKVTPAQSGANFYVQPQVAVPVFPTNMPSQPSPMRNVNHVNHPPSPALEKVVEPVKNVVRVETKIAPPPVNTSPGAESPTTPPQVSLAKAPTPWMLKRNKSQEELPEWAKRPNKSSESTPETPISPPIYVQTHQAPPPPPRQPSPQPIANQKFVQRPMPKQSQEHVVPLRVEERPSVFSAKNEPAGHHQFKESGPGHHQSRWIKQPTPQQQAGGSYIIPIMVEGQEPKQSGIVYPILSNTSAPSKIGSTENQIQRGNGQRTPSSPQQSEPGPIQSRSFRVLQKITSTDTPDEVENEQMRKLQLTDDDKSLMNKFKEQVDGDTYLHQEEDPRYRGPAIPSRAFRYLQNMTDAGEITTNTGPRAPSALNKKQNRNSKSFECESIPTNVPPSEQKVPEPKKYTGSAIPSRSFRILQAMTSPESIGPDTTDY